MNNPLNNYKGKRVLVIGGHGFIGSHLVNRLNKLESITTQTTQRFLIDEKISNFIVADLNKPSSFKNLINQKFDVVFHCGGYSNRIRHTSSIKTGIKTNILGTVHLLELIKTYSPQTKIIFIGSRQEYGVARYLPVDEQHPTNPIDPYSIEKLTISLYLNSYSRLQNLRYTVLRLSNVYGPQLYKRSQKGTVINDLLHQASMGKPITIFGDGKQLRDYLYIDDFIECLLLAGIMEESNNQIYNVGYGEPISFREMIEKIAQRSNISIKFSKWPTLYQSLETGNYVSDIRKISTQLNWKPKTNFTQGIDLYFSAVSTINN